MSEGSRSALILYGTETGNSQDVAYELTQCLQRLRFATVTREVDGVIPADLVRYSLVAFAISTTGQGDFPSNARKFWLRLLRKKLSATSLASVHYGLIGLCDSSYPKFNLAARKLHKRLQQLGAISLVEPCEADEQGEESTEGAFVSWLPLFQQTVLATFPLDAGQSPIASDKKLPSPWNLVRAFNADVRNGSSHRAAVASAKIPDQSLEASFVVALEENKRVTPHDHWQDVRSLKFRSKVPVDYMPGDALAIRPQNQPQDIEQLLELLGWLDMADESVELRSNSSIQVDDVFDSALAGESIFTLRQLLTDYLDITAIPRRSFFAKIAHFTEDEMQRERALEFTDPQYLDEYFDYATRPRRSILEVLQEFHTVKIPWEEAINIFPVLRPRQFSVASGGGLKEDGKVFELLVAIVKYRTVIKRIREGVCTRYLARLPTGTTLKVVLHTEGRFHNHISAFQRPHLLIGGGTGIAPLRSIIHEQQQLEAIAESILVFGCRSARSDYFFESEWSRLESQDESLQVITAFSRDQAGKVYIQDRIRENADSIRKWLDKEGSTVIVCGSSGAMPKAVRQALVDVLDKSGARETNGEAMLSQLEKAGRYKQETW